MASLWMLRTVCLDNILARCCGATAGTALQGDGVFLSEGTCVCSFLRPTLLKADLVCEYSSGEKSDLAGITSKDLCSKTLTVD